MQYDTTTDIAILTGIALVLTAAVGVAAAAGTLTVGERTIAVDERTQVDVTLADAPNGVQRYNLTVGVENETVGNIESVEPGDISAFQIRASTNDTVTFRAADLGQAVQPASTNVSLGRLTLTGTDPGASTLSITIRDFRNDNGEQIRPPVEAGSLVVQKSGGDVPADDAPADDAPADDAPADGAPDDGPADDGGAGQDVPDLPGPTLLWVAAGLVALVLLVGAVVYRRRTNDEW